MNSVTPDLAGKTVLITGASSGIGRTCAVAVSACGANCVLTGRDVSRLEQTRLQLPDGNHRVIAADLSQQDGRDRLLTEIENLDGAVFAAGVHAIRPTRFIAAASVDETFSINYTAPYLLTAALLKSRKINKAASLVYIGSIAIDSATVGNGLYAGSKGALLASVRILALELAKQRIRVNMVSPGQVQTTMTEKNALQLSQESIEQNEALYPLGIGSVEDVASSVLFLLSSQSRWITGQNLVVDGGYTLR